MEQSQRTSATVDFDPQTNKQLDNIRPGDLPLREGVSQQRQTSAFQVNSNGARNISQWLHSASPSERDQFLNQRVVKTDEMPLGSTTSSLSHLVECITNAAALEDTSLLQEHMESSFPPTHESATSIPPGSQRASNHKFPMFPSHNLHDFKHVLYNLVAEAHSNPNETTFLQPITVEENGKTRHGFRFNKTFNPEKKLPELYAQHIRKSRLDLQDQNSVFIQDLYKFYLRASVELLSKYFEKRDKWTYLYDDVPLFCPGESLDDAQSRLKSLQTRARKRTKKK